MSKEEVNKILKYKIGYSKDEEIEELREVYKSIINTLDEEEFYRSVLSWFFDGNAPYYDMWLKKNWSD